MNAALKTLEERGFIQQCTNTGMLSKIFGEGPVTFYVGADPTGSSLHIGHMVPFFAFRHLKNAGHHGIALIGGGTGRIGDPSGKTEMRKMLSYEQLDQNVSAIAAQLDRFLGFDDLGARCANNKDWLSNLNYIDFLREIGSHFSVNRMLSFEAYKLRMATGLSFIEFNYQLLQSYDFLELFRRYGCRLQIGGDDQWGNIVAGVELIRRIEGAEVFGLTFPLVTTSDGKKMGKTEKGAVFLDPALTAPYEFFQYWRNISDADIRRFLLMFTFLPVHECDELCAEGKNPNEAKERLAWEVTNLIHGKDEADRALSGARAAFGGLGGGGGGSTENFDSIPAARLSFSASELRAGVEAVPVFMKAGLAVSLSEARRLIGQGGAYYIENGETTAVKDLSFRFSGAQLLSGKLVLRAGKKKYARIICEEQNT